MIEHIPKKETTIDAAIADGIALSTQYGETVTIKFNNIEFWVDKRSDLQERKETYFREVKERYYRQRV